MTMPRRQLVDVAVTRYYHVSAHHGRGLRGAGSRDQGAGQPLRAMRRRARLTALASAREHRSSWR